MAQSKHTPGPWSFTAVGRVMSDRYSQPFGVVDAGKKNLICGCFGDVAGGETTAKANARLIAAAPELLAALRDMAMAYGHPDDPDVIEWWEHRAEEAAEEGRDSEWYRNEARARAAAAIAKTTTGGAA